MTSVTWILESTGSDRNFDTLTLEGVMVIDPDVDELNADATDMPLPDGRFSAALSLTILRHVPTPELQDAIFAEVVRVPQVGWDLHRTGQP